ncbi:hypothetical protein BASA81_016163 [Batrachochytrium salamandrivorans]|nr:hypothetical protein BASA81_016163 [Batrachochytrium salamandrivorans]
MSENYDQSDHIEPPIATLDQEFSNRDVLISTIKQYFYARNEVVVLDKHSDQRKVTFKCYFGGQYRNGLNLTDNTRKRQTGSRLMACRFSIRSQCYVCGHFSHLSLLPNHQVVVTDRELALVAALDIVFPFANNLLLRMACQQNILSNATKKFDDICDTDDSINDWSQLLSTVLASKHLKTDGLRFKSNGSQKQNHFGSVCARILGLIHK